MKRNSNFKKVKACLKKHGKTEEDLGDLVHDCKSAEASSLNNCGMDEQITFLIESLGPGELLASLDIPGDDVDKVIGAQ